MKELDLILNNQTVFLKFLKSRYALIHKSNLFFRDLHYGTMAYLREHGMKHKYQFAEKIASELGAKFEQNGLFKRVDGRTWMLNYPEFALPRGEKRAV